MGRVCKLDLTLRRMVEPADIYREETDTEQPRQSSTNVSQEFSHLISFLVLLPHVCCTAWLHSCGILNGQGYMVRV